MKKDFVVKKKYEFNDIIDTGKCIKNDVYVIFYKKNSLNKYRFGISVGKKIGNAVVRNKYKRRLRNIIDNNKKYYQNNKDYIIILRKSCIDLSFEQLQNKFVSIISKIKEI